MSASQILGRIDLKEVLGVPKLVEVVFGNSWADEK